MAAALPMTLFRRSVRFGDCTTLPGIQPNHIAEGRAKLSGPARLRATDEQGILRAAFRDAHGARLNGFARLVTLGDVAMAGSLAADALDEGARLADELRHPERAAAWLRGRVLRKAPRGSWRRGGPSQDERRATLAALGVDDESYDVIQRFSAAQRAALVAGVVEGLSPLDLELVLGTGAASARRRLTDTRRLFLERRANASELSAMPEPGSLGHRIRTIADSALGRTRG
jgi:hypothetical protein